MQEDSVGVSVRIEELKEKLEKDPNSKIFIQLAEEYRKSGQFEEAIQLCLAGLKRHPGYTSAHVTLGRAYAGAKRNAEAAAEFQSVIAQVPDNILANRFLGDVFFEEGRGAEALARYRVVQMLSPNDEEVRGRIRTLESGGGPSPKPAPAAAPAATEGEGDEAFMDLKIDESLILNADMIAATLKKAGAPAPPVVAQRPIAKPKPAPVAAPPAAEVNFENMEDENVGGMGFDDFSDFSSPTVMLNVKDLAKLAEAASAPPPAPPAAPPAAPVAVPPTYSSKTADKFGLPSAALPVAAQPVAPPPKPAPPPPPPPAAVAAPVAAPAPVAVAASRDRVEMDEFAANEVGEDFSEFAAPTVMLNVADLVKSGALSEDMLKSSPFGVGAPPADATPAPVAAPAPAAPQAAGDEGEAPAGEFGSLGGSFGDASTFAGMDEPAQSLDEMPTDEPAEVYGTSAFQAEDADSFGTRAFQADDLQALVSKAASAAQAKAAAIESPMEPEPLAPVESFAAAEPEEAGGPLGAMEPIAPIDSIDPIDSMAEMPAAAPSFAEEAGLLDHEPAAEGQAWWEVPAPSAMAPEPVLGSEPAPSAALDPSSAQWATADPAAADDELTSKTLGQLYLQQGHLEKALEVFGRYLESHPEDSEIRDKVGEIRRRLEPVPAPEPEPVAVPAPAVASAPAAAVVAESAEGPDDRKAKIRQKLTSWLQSTKKS